MPNEHSAEQRIGIESLKTRIYKNLWIPTKITKNKGKILTKKQTIKNCIDLFCLLVANQIKEDHEITGGLPYLTVSLVCQLTRKRMLNPVKFLSCKHIQCFDLDAFLGLICVKQPKHFFVDLYKCPICQNKAKLDDLKVDHFFHQVLHQKDRKNIRDPNSTSVKIYGNGEWELELEKVAADQGKVSKVSQ